MNSQTTTTDTSSLDDTIMHERLMSPMLIKWLTRLFLFISIGTFGVRFANAQSIGSGYMPSIGHPVANTLNWGVNTLVTFRGGSYYDSQPSHVTGGVYIYDPNNPKRSTGGSGHFVDSSPSNVDPFAGLSFGTVGTSGETDSPWANWDTSSNSNDYIGGVITYDPGSNINAVFDIVGPLVLNGVPPNLAYDVYVNGTVYNSTTKFNLNGVSSADIRILPYAKVSGLNSGTNLFSFTSSSLDVTLRDSVSGDRFDAVTGNVVAVPEPSSSLLLGLGSMTLLLRRKRKGN